MSSFQSAQRRRLASAVATVAFATGAVPAMVHADGRGDRSTVPVDDTMPTNEPAEHEEPHFAYEGEAGPEHWGELAEEWATCGEGTEQSPIDLVAAVEAPDAELPDIVFDYRPSAATLLNNGHTIQAVYDEGSSILLGDTRYQLLQFHFHAHSEHTVDGETQPLEVHFVHQAEDDRLAVVGVLVAEGAANPAFDAVLDNLPAEESEEPVVIEGATLDAATMLPADQTFFHYDGSLTTPPCSEGVSWHVMTTPITMSADQIARFTALYENDARPTQPLGDRELEVSG
jgi:carbonic anhydrase